MSIATEITRLQGIKTDIRNALVTQGISQATSHNMADFADDILSIQGGSEVIAIIVAKYPSDTISCTCLGATSKTDIKSENTTIFCVSELGNYQVIISNGVSTVSSDVIQISSSDIGKSYDVTLKYPTNVLNLFSSFTVVKEHSSQESVLSVSDNTLTAYTIGNSPNFQGHVGFFSDVLINTNGFNRITFDFKATGYLYGNIGLFSNNTSPYGWVNNVASYNVASAITNIEENGVSVDISQAQGNYYFSVVIGGNGGNDTFGRGDWIISNIYME